MNIRELLIDVDVCAISADLSAEIASVCYNSREAAEGALFVAVRGFKTDGHKYIKNAYENGAVVAIVEEAPADCPIPYVIVGDSRKALAMIASNFYNHPERRAKIIGVTGTNGKTTVTNLIKGILEAQGHKCGLIGTNGNMIGQIMTETERTTPESLELFALFNQMVNEGCSHIIMEVSSHSLVLDRVYGVEFDVGVFTNLTQDHLDFHQTMEEYGRAKSIMFSRCKSSIINIDDDAWRLMENQAKGEIMSYAIDAEGTDLRAMDVLLDIGGISFGLLYQNRLYDVGLGIPGRFSVYNALAAIGACVKLGVPMADILSALKLSSGVKGRAEVVPTGANFTVLLDYAHTPDSVENILKTARGFTKNRVVALFGCGGDRDKTKRPIMGRAAGTLADFCIVTSDNPRSEQPMDIINDILPGVVETGCKHMVIEDRREAIRYALDIACAGDVIVLMGKGHENYQEIMGEKLHLDEYEEVMNYFKK